MKRIVREVLYGVQDQTQIPPQSVGDFRCPFFEHEKCIIDYDVCPFQRIQHGWEKCDKWKMCGQGATSPQDARKRFRGALESIVEKLVADE